METPRITSKELKKILVAAFPTVKFSVQRTSGWACNHIHVTWDWSHLGINKVQEITDKYNTERDINADGIELGSQTVFLHDIGPREYV